MIKISRFMVVHNALEIAGPVESDISSPGSSANSRPSSSGFHDGEFPKDCLSLVKEAMDRYMVRGSQSPMQWMLDLRTYGLKIHYNTTAGGCIDWVGEQIVYKNIQFTMEEFRIMIHDMIDETKRMLFHDLMFLGLDDSAPIIPWASLRDNPINTEPKWNFIQDTRNPWPVDGTRWLRERIGRIDEIRRRFIKPKATLTWNKPEIRAYMARILEFRKKMVVLMPLSGGQQPRGQEMLSICHSNTQKGDRRNVFIENGMVVFVTRYHKGYHMSAKEKVIHRYLPRGVGELYVYYEWLVRPFQELMEAEIWDKKELSALVFPPDPNDRQWDAARMSGCLKEASRVGLGVSVGLQGWREMAIGISRRFLQPKHAFRLDDDDEDGDFQEENKDEIHDEQAAHTSHIAGMIYARGINELDGVVASRRERFREASVEWHRFLELDHSSVKVGRKREAAVDHDEATFRRWKRMRGVDIRQGLKEMLGECSEFQGVQEATIQAIVDGESPVVVVMGTGGGKSLAFMLPAWLSEGGTSVVVVPLIALRRNMMDRCRRFKISCVEWNASHRAKGARIVLVTPESAVSETFQTFLNQLRSAQQLDRIVIDECHVVLNDQLDFRRKLRRMGEFNRVGTQMIMLTATLPPSMEGELWKRMGFAGAAIKMFRMHTVRANVAYRIERLAVRQSTVKDLVAIIRRYLSKTSEGKMVVYCNSIEKTQDIARELDCAAYYHDAKEKDEMMRNFEGDKGRMMVATSAFGMGIDISHIRAVIHVDMPRTLLDYAQESGRAGRDGKRSEAVVMMCSESRAEDGLVGRFLKGKECQRKVLDEYLDGRNDRRGCGEDEAEEACSVCEQGWNEMEGGMDRVEVDEEESWQDESPPRVDLDRIRFDEQRRAQEEIHEVQRQRIQEDSREVKALKADLDDHQGQCPYCRRMKTEDVYHSLYRCRQTGSQPSRELYVEMRDNIRGHGALERYAGCYRCFVPQEWCNRWDRRSDMGDYEDRLVEQKDVECQYQDMVLGELAVRFRWDAEFARGLVKRIKEGGFDAETNEGNVRYLGQRMEWGGVEASRLIWEYWMNR